jgi:hypothetical protein
MCWANIMSALLCPWAFWVVAGAADALAGVCAAGALPELLQPAVMTSAARAAPPVSSVRVHITMCFLLVVATQRILRALGKFEPSRGG